MPPRCCLRIFGWTTRCGLAGTTSARADGARSSAARSSRPSASANVGGNQGWRRFRPRCRRYRSGRTRARSPSPWWSRCAASQIGHGSATECDAGHGCFEKSWIPPLASLPWSHLHRGPRVLRSMHANEECDIRVAGASAHVVSSHAYRHLRAIELQCAACKLVLRKMQPDTRVDAGRKRSTIACAACNS